MKMATFNKLKKMLSLTVTENDHEALAAIRAANRIIVEEGITWERVLNRTINVIAEVETDPEQQRPATNGEAPAVRREIDDLLDKAEDRKPDNEFVASLREQWDRKRWLSERQIDALRKVADE
jgi:hypothetical protein